MELLFATLHLIFCSFMTGVIWMVQVVHYPAFAYIEKSRFGQFHRLHTNKITWVVGPVMVAEMFSAISFYVVSYHTPKSLHWVNLSLLALTWISTFTLSVPRHHSLSQSFSSRAVQSLVLTNWPRTLAWSIRLVLALSLLVQVMRMSLPLGF